jgi:hypothetical protein
VIEEEEMRLREIAVNCECRYGLSGLARRVNVKSVE